MKLGEEHVIERTAAYDPGYHRVVLRETTYNRDARDAHMVKSVAFNAARGTDRASAFAEARDLLLSIRGDVRRREFAHALDALERECSHTA
jgi:hypothetical protein